MFEKKFSGHNKIWEAQKIKGNCSRTSPLATGLDSVKRMWKVVCWWLGNSVTP